MSELKGGYGGVFEVLSALLDWSDAGQTGALVTVLQTWGSSPRPPGSLLAIRRGDGKTAGSVSGGCVEEDLAERYRRGELADLPTTVDYGGGSFGLPCGGRLHLLVEEPSPASLKPLIEAIRGGRLLQRRVCLNTQETSLHRCVQAHEPRWENQTYYQCFGPRWHLLLVGAGPLADALGRIALTLEFRVTLCDPREGFDTDVDGVLLSRAMPDDLIASQTACERTAVITLAHDPKIDDLALYAALDRPFFYLGALGSRRSSEARLERFRSMDVADSALTRLRAPVGLNIGSRTPAEIAVAIAADLIGTRRQGG
ncbi:MAG: XdhC family protein [Chromatiales bacterium]|nr:XdhC family protein [Chromatiales bacterium]